MLEVTYELLPSDISQLFRYIRNHRHRIKPIVLYVVLSLYGLLGLTSAGFILFGPHRNGVPGSFGAGSLLELGCFFYLSYAWIIRPRFAERRAQRSPLVVGRRTMRVTTAGFSVQQALGEVTRFWPLIVDLIDDQDCLYFFLENNNALAVPKRAFTSAEVSRAFYETSRQLWQAGRNLATPNQSDVPDTWPPAPRAEDSRN